MDMRSVAKKLDMPFFTPKPDPITQSYLTGKINKNQPYIFDLCHLGQQAHNEGVGIELAYELSSNIFETNITVPHAQMHKRNFVLFPLFELNKNWIHPKFNISIKKLIFSLSIKEISSIKQI